MMFRSIVTYILFIGNGVAEKNSWGHEICSTDHDCSNLLHECSTFGCSISLWKMAVLMAVIFITLSLFGCICYGCPRRHTYNNEVPAYTQYSENTTDCTQTDSANTTDCTQTHSANTTDLPEISYRATSPTGPSYHRGCCVCQ
ncbi:uncharacterized protein LOC119085761 [Bradysia coprophila]|uniref:uncharacterized protein LOC119085761 n=1 Tax=Bradysia coprophila TaxID=38358 RepID=UPI00187D8176|nr:uncharacterized protein LOC119085761 [Bradysia coprophila]